MTTPEGILDFIAELTWDDLPPQVRRQSKLCLLDLIGVGAGGAGTKLSRIIRDYSALDMGGALPMMFDGRGASVSGVALAGGMTIDALDGHDGFNPAKGHAGCGVLPALYGLAQELGDVSGQEFLLCLTLGYELACRTAMAQHASVPDYHTSGAWVAVAVAGLAARLMGLDRAQTAHAMGIAEYHGPRSQMMRCIDHPTMLKDGSGWGAMCGVSAARLAARGFTGAPALTLSTDHWRDLGDTWLICQQYFKPYPVCRWAQAPITAVLDLQKRHGFDSRAITGLHIVSFHESVRLGTKQVTTTEEAQYSTSFPCALALVHGTVLPEHVAEAALDHPEVQRLSSILTMGEDAAANKAFPNRRMARAEITLAAGDRLQSDWFEPEWDPTDPPSKEDLEAKFFNYAGPVLGLARSQATHRAVEALDHTATAQPLLDLLAQPIS